MLFRASYAGTPENILSENCDLQWMAMRNLF